MSDSSAGSDGGRETRDASGARAALVEALKRRLATTPLSKVSVASLAADAGVTMYVPSSPSTAMPWWAGTRK